MDRFKELVEIMEELRGESGCPWDKRQDHESIKPYLIEEAYEVIEAIEEGDEGMLMEELGDLILQVVFHAQIAKERGAFGIEEVLISLNSKLRSRHPHVFGKARFETPEEVLANWERMKQEERRDGEREGVLAGLPRGLPALLKARRIQDKLTRQGKGIIEVDLEALDKSLNAFVQSLQGVDRERIGETLADLLFLLVELGRAKGVDAENALRERLNQYEKD